MKFFGKALGLTLAALALSSCGGGGGDGGAVLPPQSGKIELSATTTTLPVNVWGYQPTQYGNPTQAEVTITWRYADGTLVTGHDVAVSIAPTNVAVLSCLVDGSACTDGNALFGSMTIKGINGQATIFVNSFTTAGTAKMTVSATDPNTNRTVSNTLNFTVTSGVGPTPASISIKPSTDLVYMPSSGANSSAMLTATVTDGSGQLVPDPGSGNNVFDNLKVELVGNVGDASLSTNSASGSANGKVVTTHTVHGAATIAFHAGDSTPAGPVQIKATADRADNDVANGIQDPVTQTTSITVADGKLFSLVLTTPTTNDITVNPVSDNVTGSAGTIPGNPDGTYSMTVSALAVDRQGNPVAPGTTIEFGVVDSPMQGFPANGSGMFPISGNDGDPQESGTLFTAPTGHFVTAGGGAGPGDTLLVFGGNETFGGYAVVPPGNRDLNSARTVGRVNSETSLNVTYPFNPNDDTGAPVNNGPVLPYVIGRATEGNIGASATTDINGVARTTLNYPVSRLGKGALIWARGSGAAVSGTPRLVTTMSGGGFAGVAPGHLVVDQTPIMGNKVVPVQVCLYDALDAPIQGAYIKFSFSGLDAGTGSVDGVVGSGVLAEATGSDGCAVAMVATSGLVGGGSTGGPTLTFSAGQRVPALPVPITAPSGGLVLQASPSTLGGNGGVVTLVLTDSSGNPVAGGQINGTCDAGASLSVIGATDASGHTTVTVTANLDAYGKSQTATCTFTGPGDNAPTAKVTVQGSDLCLANPTSPQCASEILTALPQTLPGNGGTVVLVLTDAGGNALEGAQIGGVCTAGASAGAIGPTNSSGRTSVAITADLDGYGSSKDATCTFSAPGVGSQAGPKVTVYLQGTNICTTHPTDSHCGSLLLQALPSSLGGSGGTVTLLLTDAGGSPLAGVQIVGTCQSGAGIGSAIAPTATNGRTTAAISADLDAYGTVNTSSCTFSTGLSDGPTVTVNLTGTDLCQRFPNDSRCDGGGTTDQIAVVLQRSATVLPSVTANVSSVPNGITCNLPANTNVVVCNGSFADGSTVVFNATRSTANNPPFAFSGCTQQGSATPPAAPTNASAKMTVAAGATCTITVN